MLPLSLVVPVVLLVQTEGVLYRLVIVGAVVHAAARGVPAATHFSITAISSGVAETAGAGGIGAVGSFIRSTHLAARLFEGIDEGAVRSS
jgi:hypothetical protein